MDYRKLDRLDLVDMVNRNATRLCQIASLNAPPPHTEAAPAITSAKQWEIVAIVDVLLMLGELVLDMEEFDLDLGNLQERIGKIIMAAMEIGEHGRLLQVDSQVEGTNMETANGLLNRMWAALLQGWKDQGRDVLVWELATPEELEKRKESDVIIMDEEPFKVDNISVLVSMGGQEFRIHVQEVTKGGPKGLVYKDSPAHEIWSRACQGEGCRYCRMAALI